MLINPTIDTLRALGLYGMATRFPGTRRTVQSVRPRARRMAYHAARARGDHAPPEALRGPRQSCQASP